MMATILMLVTMVLPMVVLVLLASPVLTLCTRFCSACALAVVSTSLTIHMAGDSDAKNTLVSNLISKTKMRQCSPSSCTQHSSIWPP